MMPYVNPNDKKFQAVPYIPFIDYKTGKSSYELSLDTKEYWKPLSKVVEDYLNHNDSKFEGYIGLLQRKHIMINRFKYIGKESNELEDNEFLGLTDYTEYENGEDFKKFVLALRPKNVKSMGYQKWHCGR